MFRDQSTIFRMAARLARWLCSSSECAHQARADKDIMKRLKSIHNVLSRKAKMVALAEKRNGKRSRLRTLNKEPAAQCTVAVASLLHTISSSDM